MNESGGIINLIPIMEGENDCPLRGLAADSGLTVDKFLAMTHDERKLGNERYICFGRLCPDCAFETSLT